MATIGDGLPKGLTNLEAYLPPDGNQPGFSTPEATTAPFPGGLTPEAIQLESTVAGTTLAPIPGGLDDPQGDYTPDADVDVGIAAAPYFGPNAVGGQGSVGSPWNNRTSLLGNTPSEDESDALPG